MFTFFVVHIILNQNKNSPTYLLHQLLIIISNLIHSLASIDEFHLKMSMVLYRDEFLDALIRVHQVASEFLIYHLISYHLILFLHYLLVQFVEILIFLNEANNRN